MRKSGV